VAIDNEGQDYPGYIPYQGVRYPRHDTYLWGAAADDGREPAWLTDAETHGMDKRPLAVEKILDWLLDLPRQFGKAVFVMFSFRYDIAQILKHLDYYTAWEIFKHETHPDKGVVKTIGHAPVFWKGYAIHYIDGKCIDIKRLANPDKPSQGGRSKYSARIRIYDVFGFWGSSFSAVVGSMVQSGRATSDEDAFVREMKARRENFGSEDIGRIKSYTAMELRLLARMMTDLRKGLAEIGLHLRDWHGAGAAAAALIEAKNLKAHYGPDIAASNITPQQDAAHHAFHGAHIESLKQGYMENAVLHCYDIASAYPAGMVDLPSLGLVGGARGPLKDMESEIAAFFAWLPTAEGKWINRPGSDIPTGSLAELRKAIEATSPVSMFKIRFQFPAYEKFHPDPRRAVFIPFYPLPYRQKRGGILFPAGGYGWYMRDHVLGAIAWLERFVPDFPRPRDKLAKITAFNFEEAWIFEPAPGGRADERPFGFVVDLFGERRRIKEEIERSGKYDIREKALKLALNSVYGKLAQSVGREGWAPAVANPYYAAATTAYCQRRVLEAALLDPHAIVFFATDGIVSTRELQGLPRVRKKGEIVDLGDWEYSQADSGLFVLPGVYTYGKVEYDKNGGRTIKPVTKLRGGDPKKYDATVESNKWLIDNVLAAWRTPFDPRGSNEQFPRIVRPYKKYITVGNALASPWRWKLAGRWTVNPSEPGAATRDINVHTVGNKRDLIPDESCWPDYVSTSDWEARRCRELIRTIPALNNDTALSRPRMPEWLNEDIGREVEDQEEQEEIAAGFE
jgi:hypothetical protein